MHSGKKGLPRICGYPQLGFNITTLTTNRRDLSNLKYTTGKCVPAA